MSVSAPPHSLAPAAAAVARRSDADETYRRGLERVLLGLVAAAALARLILVWRLNVNWDEFYYLSFVHDYRNGRLAQALQTFHVHFFQWVLSAGTNEVDQIIAARVAYFALSLGSCALVYAIARRFVSRPAALFSALCYLCYSNILEHGMSFRADGLVSFLTLAAIALVLRSSASPVWCAFAGGLTAVALLVTIKTVFMVPTIAIVLVARTWPLGRRRMLGNLAALSGAFAVVLTVCFLGHAAGVRGATVAQAASYSRRVGNVTVGGAGLLPQWSYIVMTFAQNGFVWIYVASGLVLARSSWFLSRRSRRDALALFALALPLASLIFYRNSFPYYYVLLIPPVLVLCALPFEIIVERAPKSDSNQRMVIYMIAGVVWAFSLRFGMRLPNQVRHQRELAAAVHKIFPEPVPYIDRSGFVASFPNVGFFMSTWGMQGYVSRGVLVFEDLLKTRKPAFLLVNSPALVLFSADTIYAGTAAYALFNEDRRVLRENFVHHWGPLYVAGKRITLSGSATDVQVIIPGTYTIESSTAVGIDGVRYSSGDTVTLASGSHSVVSFGSVTDVTLRWGRSLWRPSSPPAARRIFVGF